MDFNTEIVNFPIRARLFHYSGLDHLVPVMLLRVRPCSLYCKFLCFVRFDSLIFMVIVYSLDVISNYRSESVTTLQSHRSTASCILTHQLYRIWCPVFVICSKVSSFETVFEAMDCSTTSKSFTILPTSLYHDQVSSFGTKTSQVCCIHSQISL